MLFRASLPCLPTSLYDALWRPPGPRRGGDQMVMRVIMLVAFAATVSSCAQPWVKPGATAADFEREKLLCRDEAEKATAAVTHDPNNLEMLRLLDLCLQERGWTRG